MFRQQVKLIVGGVGGGFAISNAVISNVASGARLNSWKPCGTMRPTDAWLLLASEVGWCRQRDGTA